MILVDSGVWIDYFNGVATAQTDRLDGLLGLEPVAIADVVLTEVLQSFGDDRAFEQAREALEALHLVEIAGPAVALEAARNYRRLRARGITIRKTIDTLIATRCIHDAMPLLYADRDFDPFVAHLGLRSALPPGAGEGSRRMVRWTARVGRSKAGSTHSIRKPSMTPTYPPEAFAKADPTDDAAFYRPARMVTHIDDAAIAALSANYAARIAPGADVLDLMSSWVSHLPEGLPLGHVLGHGMNAAEMAANPRLDGWWVQDLNRDPVLPLEDASRDAVLVCVGVQYLQRPVEVFAEAARVLRPGGRVIVSYSNRCFYTKAVTAWLSRDMAGRAALVAGYLEAAGFGDVAVEVLADGRAGDPFVAVDGRVG